MKYYGNIGFVVTEETSPGVWSPTTVLKKYYGDMLRLMRNTTSGEHINDGLQFNSQISILCDPWFDEHLSQIKFVEFMNCRWKIASVDVNYPRINLTLGGLYNENETGDTEST